MREVIAAPHPGLDLRQHYGHHQSAIRAGGLIFCSGMLPVDPETASAATARSPARRTSFSEI